MPAEPDRRRLARGTRRALALGADHLSLYELSIEPGAAFFQAVKRKDWSPLDDERAADLYQITQELADAAGYSAYEISNHARGPEHQSAHNRIYWSSGDWAGVGPGAHGRLTSGPQRWAIEAAEKPGEYLQQVKTNGLGWAVVDALDPLAQARERVSMGCASSRALRPPTSRNSACNSPAPVAEFLAAGLITNENGRIALTRSGRLMADRITQRFPLKAVSSFGTVFPPQDGA
jgi:coproporphyrinogen III oxidase-like Fe-S oxidoreductase